MAALTEAGLSNAALFLRMGFFSSPSGHLKATGNLADLFLESHVAKTHCSGDSVVPSEL